jgi:DNA replication protein DnaC
LSPCPECGGTGFVYVAREGREYAQPCQCRRAAQSAAHPAEHCRIPPRYEHCRLESFTPGTPSLRAALEKCLRYCNGYPYVGPTDEGLGLLLCGDSGVGKTHLAVSVLKQLVETKGARGQFWDFHELIREIKNSYNPETLTTELQVLEPVVLADVLLLDDLGAWKMTDWMNDTLFYILNSRYMAKRATLITTNYQDADREAVLAADPLRRREFLVERIGQRLRSRLQEMCLVVRLDSGDYRQALQSANQASLGVAAPEAPRRRQ